MAILQDTSLTLTMDGEVSLSQFSQTTTFFYQLLQHLATQVLPNQPVQFVVSELAAGSAQLCVEARYPEPSLALELIAAYDRVGEALVNSASLTSFSTSVQTSARALRGMVGSTISSMRFDTINRTSIIRPWSEGERTKPNVMMASGLVNGTVQGLSSGHALRFTLYEAVQSRPVSCYIGAELSAVLTDIVLKRALVYGDITYDGVTGVPVSVRKITDIELIPNAAPENWRAVSGILKFDREVESITKDLQNEGNTVSLL